jgi:diguanylate cyclase (GGDEF)-like protein/PAS domain S-box-containing protein
MRPSPPDARAETCAFAVKLLPSPADAGQVNPPNGQLLATADHAASAALRELPEALVIVFDRQLRFVLTAGQAIERMGDPDICREGNYVADAFPAEFWERFEPLFSSALEGETRTREIWTSEERHCLMVDAGPLCSDGGPASRDCSNVDGGVAVVLDITARRRADLISAPRRTEGFEEVFEHAPIGTGLIDNEGRWLLVNRALCEITGYTSDELVGKRFDGIMHPEDAVNDAIERRRLQDGEIPAYQVEKRYFDAAGETVSAILSMSLVRDRDGQPLHYIAQLQDISARKELEEQLLSLADHDPLTGLRNRRLFEHDLRLQLGRCHRYGETAGLMVIDLDGFRELNRQFGSAVGDETLRSVSRALTRRLRETDLIGRLGGDEFAVLLPHADEEGLSVVVEGLERVIPACSVDAGAGVVHPAASIGFTLVHQRSPELRQVLVDAERALNAAKRAKA